ncbi:hypothetical protein Q8A67_016862 [Cirrhinus molitorella]|uniref:Uncharacterized protein n=1 Tax=Cirrhinus molitorella TaxID=172907 RepID=A0AA88PDP7_9TELE|nr:hypothetical protein Q8A67_016862 [Cirrhinus molitorella]
MPATPDPEPSPPSPRCAEPQPEPTADGEPRPNAIDEQEPATELATVENASDSESAEWLRTDMMHVCVCVCSLNSAAQMQTLTSAGRYCTERSDQIRVMSNFHRSERAPRLFLMMCVWGIFPLPAEQLPVRGAFNLLLYPVSVMGPYGSRTVLIPVTGTEQNTQGGQTPQAIGSKISAQSVSKPLHANGAFLKPDPAPSPTPGLHPVPSESLVQQGQMSNFAPSNVPLQVYSFVQQAVIADSGSSEEGAAAQVIYMVPVGVDSPNMGVMEGTVPNPDRGHLQVQASTPAAATAAQPDAQGQLGKTAGAVGATETLAAREKGL